MQMTEADILAHSLITRLDRAYPGTTEEWERQRGDAIATGDRESDWPGFVTAAELRWWLQSEVDLVIEEFGPADETGREAGIGEFCATAVEIIDRALVLEQSA